MTEGAQQTGRDKTAVHPFHVNVPEAELTELRRRISTARWPERETVTDDSQGVPLAMIQELARYWAADYDWRRCEAKLNALPQFMTEIDGLDIHFIHVRSDHDNALPLIVTHGWPGSIIEQLKIIDPLANPTAHGAGASDAFHLVIPSMPGYGFSGKPTATGWDPALGMPANGLRHLELAAKLASGAVLLSVGTRPDVHGKAFSAHAHWLLGHEDEALAACREAITLARAIDHPYSQAVALAYGSITHQVRRDLPQLRSMVDELRRLCDRYDFAYYREWALILDGWSREGASGADLVRRGIGNLKSEGAFARMPYWLSLLADLSARDSRAAPRGPPLTPRSLPGASTTTCGGYPR